MRTGLSITMILQVFVALLPMFGRQVATAQDVSDTLRRRQVFDTYWTKPRLVPRLGVGAQDRAFFEAGIYWQNIYKHPLSLASKGPYMTVDVFVDNKNLLLGPKLGYQFTAGVFGVASDVTYYIDHNYDGEGGNRNAWVFTPKGGLTILGFADLYYGWTIPISTERITTITRNRVSLVINLNRDYFDLQDAPRRRRR